MQNIIGTSLSKPHIYRREVHARFLYILYVRHPRAPPYTKRVGRMKYLAMISQRQEKSITYHMYVYVLAIKQASATQQTVVVMLSKEQA